MSTDHPTELALRTALSRAADLFAEIERSDVSPYVRNRARDGAATIAAALSQKVTRNDPSAPESSLAEDPNWVEYRCTVCTKVQRGRQGHDDETCNYCGEGQLVFVDPQGASA